MRIVQHFLSGRSVVAQASSDMDLPRVSSMNLALRKREAGKNPHESSLGRCGRHGITASVTSPKHRCVSGMSRQGFTELQRPHAPKAKAWVWITLGSLMP